MKVDRNDMDVLAKHDCKRHRLLIPIVEITGRRLHHIEVDWPPDRGGHL